MVAFLERYAVPQGFLSLNVENVVTIGLMAIGLYLITVLFFQLIQRGLGGAGSSGGVGSTAGTAPGLSWTSSFNLAA